MKNSSNAIQNIFGINEKELWKNCIFIFDTSSLLDLYEKTPDRKELYFKIFNIIKDRLWLPGHVKTEFLQNKNRVKNNLIENRYGYIEDEYIKRIDRNLNAINNTLINLINDTKKNNQHPYIDSKIFDSFKKSTQEYKNIYEGFKNKLNELIEKEIKNLDSSMENDMVLKNIYTYFDIGQEFNFEEMMRIINKAEERFKYNIPPGYTDYNNNQKEGIKKFGDLIIWKQIINKAKEKSKPIIFITNDVKRDWCEVTRRNSGKRIKNPKYELMKELKDKANVDFWMYTLSQFSYKASNILDLDHCEIKYMKETQKMPCKIIITRRNKEMNYVPTLRLRGEERMAIRETEFNQKMLPLLEIVKEKPDQRFKGDFKEIYLNQLNYIDVPFMIDIPQYFSVTGSTQEYISDFLGRAQRDDSFIIKKYKELSSNSLLIPVISYNPNTSFPNGKIDNMANELSTDFDKLSYRIYYNNFNQALVEIRKNIKKNDILIFDIDEASENSPALTPYYDKINEVKEEKKCFIVILRSVLPDELTNTDLQDNEPIPEANNSILTTYDSFGFDAFGDFAGIKKDRNITDGGTISPGFIFYYGPENFYVGYGHRKRMLSEFENHIIPTLFESEYWKNTSNQHKENCPGCQTIIEIDNGNESGKHQGKWKRISIMHYLYSLKELL